MHQTIFFDCLCILWWVFRRPGTPSWPSGRRAEGADRWWLQGIVFIWLLSFVSMRRLFNGLMNGMPAGHKNKGDAYFKIMTSLRIRPDQFTSAQALAPLIVPLKTQARSILLHFIVYNIFSRALSRTRFASMEGESLKAHSNPKN